MSLCTRTTMVVTLLQLVREISLLHPAPFLTVRQQDINKIIRAAYGPEVVYQNMSFEAVETWQEWNRIIASGRDLPPGMGQGDEIWVNNGNLQMCGQAELPPFETASIENMSRAGKRHTQVLVNDRDDVRRAESDGFAFAVDPFHRRRGRQPYQALLDTSGGFVHADRACRLVLHLARRAGVHFVLGERGHFAGYEEDPSGAVIGVRTTNGVVHPARLTIAACGGWTQQIVPGLDTVCETTAGSVALVKIPRTSSLFERFSPHNFPTWTYKMRDGAAGGLYGFPIDGRGILKIGYRGTKYINPQQAVLPTTQAGGERSVPLTRWSRPASATRVPSEALDHIRCFLDEFLPELGREGLNIGSTRLCWYNDTFDNHFLVDAVPDKKGLMVATGGSGHAFMFLPNIGKYVVDRVEGKQSEELDLWKWRTPSRNVAVKNVLGEGRTSARALQNLRFYQDDELILGRAKVQLARKSLL